MQTVQFFRNKKNYDVVFAFLNIETVNMIFSQRLVVQMGRGMCDTCVFQHGKNVNANPDKIKLRWI